MLSRNTHSKAYLTRCLPLSTERPFRRNACWRKKSRKLGANSTRDVKTNLRQASGPDVEPSTPGRSKAALQRACWNDLFLGRLGPDAGTAQNAATCSGTRLRGPCKRQLGRCRDVGACGFHPYFPRNSPIRRRAFCGNLPDMRLSHSKRQKGAKRSRHLWRVVPE